jgi:hypothetical protein
MDQIAPGLQRVAFNGQGLNQQPDASPVGPLPGAVRG